MNETVHDFEKSMNIPFSLRLKHFGRDIHLFYPSFSFSNSPSRDFQPKSFPSFSITGSKCSLNCEHCRGKLLKYMIPAESPKQLKKHCVKLYKRGGRGCLISGGSVSKGAVPLVPFLNTLKDIKSETNLQLVVHTGLTSPDVLFRLAEIGVDIVTFDFLGSTKVIKEIYHLNAEIEDYEKTIRYMSDIGLRFVPHILVGLYHGELIGEKEALDIIRKYNPHAVVFIIFTPFKDTLMESDNPPSIRQVVELIASARITLPTTPLILGCMRPLKNYRESLDLLSIKAGINGLAYPSKGTYQSLIRMGLNPVLHDTCCSLIFLAS